MKTVDLQNCSDIKDWYQFKVVVDGEEYAMNHRFLTIDVPDDKPSKIKIEYNLDGHPTSSGSFVYTYSPKDNNVVLQISKNRWLIKNFWISCAIGMVLFFIIAFLCENRHFNAFFSCCVPMSFMVIYSFIKKKKFFVIHEVQKSERKV